jgi:putative FmdB family regulatory protein
MPLYEYQCTKCKHRFERIRKFSDRPITKCPECGSKVEQLISAAAVQFKGSGWYVTDYAKSGSSGSSDSGSSDSGSSAKLVDKDSGGSKDSKAGSSNSDSSSGSKPESKPESRPESKSDSKSESKSESKSSSKKSDKKKS